jgi:hypothetical protein
MIQAKAMPIPRVVLCPQTFRSIIDFLRKTLTMTSTQLWLETNSSVSTEITGVAPIPHLWAHFLQSQAERCIHKESLPFFPSPFPSDRAKGRYMYLLSRERNSCYFMQLPVSLWDSIPSGTYTLRREVYLSSRSDSYYTNLRGRRQSFHEILKDCAQIHKFLASRILPSEGYIPNLLEPARTICKCKLIKTHDIINTA